MNYKSITDSDFEEVVVTERRPAVLVFGAEWSGNSEIMYSMIERLSKEFNSEIHFFKVDLDKQIEISRFFGIQSVPTTILLKDGEVVDLIKGFIPAKKIRKKIKAVFIENE